MPTNIATALVTGTIFKHGDPIVYECLPGHVQAPESNMKRTCYNGATSPDPTTGADQVVCYKRKQRPTRRALRDPPAWLFVKDWARSFPARMGLP